MEILKDMQQLSDGRVRISVSTLYAETRRLQTLVQAASQRLPKEAL